jgi:hypothetical protein
MLSHPLPSNFPDNDHGRASGINVTKQMMLNRFITSVDGSGEISLEFPESDIKK